MMSPDKFISAVAPPTESVWADIGCGPGFFTLPLAKRVASVQAVDISQEMLDLCRQRADAAGLTNIDYVSVQDHRLPFDDGGIDFLLLVNVLHEYDDREKAIGELYRVLAPGGLAYVIDWKNEEMEAGPPLDHRISAEQVSREMMDLGFQALSPLMLYEMQYTLPFAKESD